MALPKKLLVIIIIPVIICLSQKRYSVAGEDWQLNDNLTEISDADEIELGKQVDEYIRRQFEIKNDPERNTAVNGITQRLVTVSDRKALPFACDIIQSNSINAFSAPGGHIYLTDGLLQFTKSEDEMAGIIGHEIAHASLRHVSKLYHEVMGYISNRGNGTDTTAVLLLLNNRLEEFEQEADTVGVLYAYKAGFDPDGLPDFLERHLDLLLHNGIFGLLRFDSYITISVRINHLREYISTLIKQE